MAQYLIHWTSLDPKVTTSLFASGILAFRQQDAVATDTGSAIDASELVGGIVVPQNIKLTYSVHVVGEPQGFVLVQASPEDIHQLVLALSPGTFDLEIFDVIDDAEAKAAMRTRSADYKLK